ncbi:hypothetical protein CBR_g49557 [Chara braunii]|uniref:CCHC-type domain-containing protein n=1 Tax=Chara braunii TaxID=69332 RepID=A0A388M539_CHABU|nr:hypothetical protein CBR_g49557 [Chara braunii]|eukprot:GBG89704.1 hypothetical protein CBR_g49557 [Chara braunii]
MKEEPIVVESDDEAQEVVRESALTILETMEDLLAKVGRYQEQLRVMCEETREWEMNLPEVMLYGSGPESSSGPQGCPSVATAGAGPRSGMTFRPPTSHGGVPQASQTRGQSKATASQGPSQAPGQAPPRREPEPERRKEVVEVQEEEDEGDNEEDERLRQEEDRRVEQRAKKRGIQGGAEPSLHDGVPKRKKYAVRLEEGFDVERMVDKLLEGHNDLMNLKDILASAPRLRGELKGRLSRRLVPNVHLSSIMPKEIEWTEAGTKMDWKCVACGLVDLKVRDQPSIAMVDTGAEMNIIQERDATMLGLEVDHSDHGVLHGANCKAIFCGTASNVMVEIGRVRMRMCFFVMPDVDHPILLGRSFLCRTETLVFNRHEGTMILALSDPACGNYEIIKCRNTRTGSGRNRLNLGSFTFEESEYERRRLREEQEEEGAGEAGPCRINDENDEGLIIDESGFLSPQERTLMVETMKRRHCAYAFNEDEYGRLDVDKIPMIRIHTVPHEPWNLRGARYPNPDEEKKVVDYLDRKMRTYVADYSSGPYASPWFCFITPNGTLRWVQDLQRLNAVTVRDVGGLPNADALSESCAGRPIISLIDLYSRYDQFPVYPPDRPVTAMHTPTGLIHMNVAPQGWTNAVAMVQRHMIRAMQTVSPHITQPYIDDLAVKGPKEKEEDEVMSGVRRFVWRHIQDIDQVLGLLKEHNLTASGPKSKHCMREATILGFVCNEKGRRPDVKKTDKILEWSVPFQSITDVRSFIGTCGFFRSFVKDFATKTEHLRKLVRHEQEWVWGEDQERAVERMKGEFKEGGLVLGAPNYEATEERPFVVETDAGPTALGGELDIPGETPFRSLATHLDVSRWEASRLGEGSIEPARYVPLEEPLDPETETDMGDREGPQDPGMAAEKSELVRPQGGEVITIGDDTHPCSPVPEPAQHSWPEGIPEPGSEEIPEFPPETTAVPEQEAEMEEQGAGEGARTKAIHDLPSAEMEAAGIELTPPVKPKTSKQRIDELWAIYECQRDAACQRSQEKGQADEEAGELREMGDSGFSATRMAIELGDKRMREVAVTSFQRYSLLNDELTARRLEVEHLTTQLAEEGARSQAKEVKWERRFGEMAAIVDRLSAAWEASQTGPAGADGQGRGTHASSSRGAAVEAPRQDGPMGEVPLDTTEKEGGAQESLMAMSTERRGSRLHKLAVAMGVGTPQERPQRLDAPEYAPRLGELRAELGSWATETNSGGPDSGRQQQQEIMSDSTAIVGSQPSGSCGDKAVMVIERPHEEGPRELDMPDCRPLSTAVREGEGAEAMEPGPQGHMGSPSCHEVTTETMGTPSASSSQGRKKKTGRWHDTSCFWCKEKGHRAVDCPELLEDKAEGRVAEFNGKFYDRQGRIVERAPDGGRARLYRQNQEKLYK